MDFPRKALVALAFVVLLAGQVASVGTAQSNQQNIELTNVTVEQSSFATVTDKRTVEIPSKYGRNTDIPLVEMWTPSNDPRAALSVMASYDTDDNKVDEDLLLYNATSGELETYPGQGFPKYSRTTYVDGKVLSPSLIPWAFDISTRSYDEYENTSYPSAFGSPVRGPVATPTFYVQATGAKLLVVVRHAEHSPETVEERPIMNVEDVETSVWPYKSPWALFLTNIADRKIDGEWGNARVATADETVYYLHEAGQQGYSKYLLAYNLSTAEKEWDVSNLDRTDYADLRGYDGKLYALDATRGEVDVYSDSGIPEQTIDIFDDEFDEIVPGPRPERGRLVHVGPDYVVSATTGYFNERSRDERYATAGVTVYDRNTGEAVLSDRAKIPRDNRPPTDPVAVHDGRVYFAANKNVTAYHLATGERLVSFETWASGHNQPGAVAATDDVVSVAISGRIESYDLATYRVNATVVDDGNAVRISVAGPGDSPVTDGTVSLGETTADLADDGTAMIESSAFLGENPNSGVDTVPLTIQTGENTFETTLSAEVQASMSDDTSSGNDANGGNEANASTPFFPDLGGPLGTLVILLLVGRRAGR